MCINLGHGGLFASLANPLLQSSRLTREFWPPD
jgi:hypothetical protein